MIGNKEKKVCDIFQENISIYIYVNSFALSQTFLVLPLFIQNDSAYHLGSSKPLNCRLDSRISSKSTTTIPRFFIKSITNGRTYILRSTFIELELDYLSLDELELELSEPKMSRSLKSQ